MGHQKSPDRADDRNHARRWVVGVDGSECSRHAALWAAAHAPDRAVELQLTATWNIPVSVAMPPMGPVTSSTSFEALEQSAQATVDELARCLAPPKGVLVTQSVGQGGAASLLLDAAQSSDLLVVGSRGRGGFARLVLGSTSTQCATHSSAPVAVIPATAPIEAATSIVVAFDGSDNSIAALLWANEFAAPGSEIQCVSVWDSSPIASGADEFLFPDSHDLAGERFHRCFADALDPIKRDDIEVRHAFVDGRPRSVLAEFAGAADLLVMGARGHGAIGAALLGSVSTWLLHHIQRPMVVVPRGVPDGNDRFHDEPEAERDDPIRSE